MTNHLNQFVKSANKSADPGAALNASLQSDARRNVLNMLVAGLGLGAAARGGAGLMNLARRNKPRPSPVNTFHIPSFQNEDEEQLKTAEGGSWIPKFDWKGWAKGDQARSLTEIPWFPPAALTAGLGGAYGGWKALDHVMDSRREDEQDQELEKAKIQFQQALQGSNRGKYASDNELGLELDSLFDDVKTATDAVQPGGFDKTAEGIPGGRVLGSMAGLYGLYALLSGGAMGRAAYTRAKKKTGPEVLDEAVKRRQRMRAAARPSAAYATPAPLSKSRGDDERDLQSIVSADNGLLGFDSTPSRSVTRQY